MSDERQVEIAYYYPEPFWRMNEAGWVKSLLLFFDKVGILLPQYMRGHETAADPVTAGPLMDSGHLIAIEPETFVDAELTEALAASLVELIAGGAFDELERSGRFAELSMSRMGFGGDRGLYEMVLEELQKQGLAQETEDGVSVPLHPIVRRVYLLLLAQFARHAGERHGLALHPTTNYPGVGSALRDLLDTDGAPSKGHVVEFDLNIVGLDLENVPLNEVLDFREQHGDQYAMYMRDMRRFLAELSLAGPDERTGLFEERAHDLRSRSEELTNRIRKVWHDPTTAAGFAFGIVGAGWSATTGDPVGTFVGLGALGVGLRSLLSEQEHGSAYSYLFAAHRNLACVG